MKNILIILIAVFWIPAFLPAAGRRGNDKHGALRTDRACYTGEKNN